MPTTSSYVLASSNVERPTAQPMSRARRLAEALPKRAQSAAQRFGKSSADRGPCTYGITSSADA